MTFLENIQSESINDINGIINNFQSKLFDFTNYLSNINRAKYSNSINNIFSISDQLNDNINNKIPSIINNYLTNFSNNLTSFDDKDINFNVITNLYSDITFIIETIQISLTQVINNLYNSDNLYINIEILNKFQLDVNYLSKLIYESIEVKLVKTTKEIYFNKNTNYENIVSKSVNTLTHAVDKCSLQNCQYSIDSYESNLSHILFSTDQEETLLNIFNSHDNKLIADLYNFLLKTDFKLINSESFYTSVLQEEIETKKSKIL